MTTFRMWYGNYTLLVMFFGMMNVLTTFKSLMNGIFKPFLDLFVIVFLYDMQIYSKSKEEHACYFCISLEILKVKQLFAKFSKFEFWMSSLAILGYLVLEKGNGRSQDDRGYQELAPAQLCKRPCKISTILILIVLYA